LLPPSTLSAETTKPEGAVALEVPVALRLARQPEAETPEVQ
jgi:hypothetical protein